MTAKNLGSFLKQLLYLLFYHAVSVYRRNKKVWIYGATFRDNTKYFFLYATQHHPEITHIWISPSVELVQKLRGLGYRAYRRNSLPSIYYALIARVYICHAQPKEIIHPCFRGSAMLFNLWHGVGIKKIEYDMTKGPGRQWLNPSTLKEKLISFSDEPKTFRNPTAVLTTGKRMAAIFSSAFRLPLDKVCIGPYPRNEILLYPKKQLWHHIHTFEDEEFSNFCQQLESYRAVLIYMPTYRDVNLDFMDQAITDFDRLHEKCAQYNIMFLIKSHVTTRFNVDLAKYTHIKNLDAAMDIYPLLPFTDALVSDYSSVILDYSFLNKKIIFYPFDKDEYLNSDREFYFEYEEMFSSEFTSTFEQLLAEIDAIAKEDIRTKSYSYARCASFFDKEYQLNDIVSFIKNEINY